jgi:predicted SAM-dependent methyltransferase
MQAYPDLVRLIRLARFEMQLAVVSFKAVCSPRQWRSRYQLKKSDDLKVQIGSGPNPVAGWVNIDGGWYADIQIDLRHTLPLRTGSVAYIFTEHFLDHLEYPNGIGRLLSECNRVLKPGGIMRAIVHDAELLLRAYVNKDLGFFRQIGAFDEKDDNPSLITVINHLFRFNGFHQFIYDYETLKSEFFKAGFSTVHRSEFRQSLIPELNLDMDSPDRAPQSLYIEAVK